MSIRLAPIKTTLVATKNKNRSRIVFFISSICFSNCSIFLSIFFHLTSCSVLLRIFLDQLLVLHKCLEIHLPLVLFFCSCLSRLRTAIYMKLLMFWTTPKD
nr:MAG TPA: hypothetical protein [Caudoviricetes sp.]